MIIIVLAISIEVNGKLQYCKKYVISVIAENFGLQQGICKIFYHIPKLYKLKKKHS